MGPFSLADKAMVVGLDEDARITSIEMLMAAQNELNLSRFHFSDDLTSLTGAAAIADRVKNGVKVRMVIDGLNNQMPRCLQAYILHYGGEIREFHSTRFDLLRPLVTLRRFLNLNNRMHDKTMMIDRRFSLVGGRNVGDDYFFVGKEKKPKLDLELIVEGESTARKLNSYFEQLWESDEVEPFQMKITEGDLAEAEVIIAERMLRIAELRIEDPLKVFHERAVEVAPDDLRFVHDVPGAKTSHPGTVDAVVDLLNSAKPGGSIKIVTPYLVLTERAKKALVEAASRGARISIVTNSIESTDVVLPQANYERDKKFLFDLGVEIFELTETGLHAKVVIVDDETAFIGSLNMNHRSAHLDTETGFIVKSPVLVAKTLKLWEHLKPQVTLVTNPAPRCSTWLLGASWFLKRAS